jgi:four helix bundle protein
VIRLVEALPATKVGGHVGHQLFRAATSAGANYEEARGAESRADFVRKVGVAWKEARESAYWLKLVHRAELVKPALLEGLLREAGELSAILGQSKITASGQGGKDAPPGAETPGPEQPPTEGG